MTIEVDQAIAELQEMVECRCDPAYEDRGLHDPNCQCDYASEVQVIVDYIEQLNAKIKKLDKLVYNSYCDGFVEAWDCPCISSGYTFTWESSETYKALKEITGNTDGQ
jgi:hypothetical protein